jgi:hypothetical protein
MKLIKLKSITAELDNLGATAGYKALVLNNVNHYNELVTEHVVEANLKREYLMYQLNVQICKLLLDLKKAYDKLQAAKPKDDEEDEFTKMMKEIKG